MIHARPLVLGALIVIVTAGAAAGTTILVPSEQPTIQQGIDAAVAGDIVQVAPGTYTGELNRDLDFGGVNITLESESGAGVTVIDCESAGRGFFFHSGEDTTSVVRGFTITSAAADSGAGAFCIAGSSPRFEECTFTDCMATERGGGLGCRGSSPVVRACDFVGNAATGSARMTGRGGAASCEWYAAPRFSDTEFAYNSAHDGGGLTMDSASPQVNHCLFLENVTDEYGHGAGAQIISCSGVAFANCEFRENGVTTGVGGGAHITSSDITVTDCLFVDNISGSAGGLHVASEGTMTITGCTFIGNVGEWSAAGAIQCHFGAAPAIANCTFVGNDYQHVWLEDSSPTLTYCIFAFGVGGGAVYCEDGTEMPVINHCFVFGNAGGDSLCGDYANNRFDDPLLCDYETGDVTLCADSPCLPGVTWTSHVGSQMQGCDPCGSATEQRTWGVIKAMYR